MFRDVFFFFWTLFLFHSFILYERPFGEAASVEHRTAQISINKSLIDNCEIVYGHLRGRRESNMHARAGHWLLNLWSRRYEYGSDSV